MFKDIYFNLSLCMCVKFIVKNYPKAWGNWNGSREGKISERIAESDRGEWVDEWRLATHFNFQLSVFNPVKNKCLQWILTAIILTLFSKVILQLYWVHDFTT